MIRFFSDDVVLPQGLEDKLVPVIERICAEHGMAIDYLNVVFVSDERLLEINRDFLRHDYYTDIITFNYVEDPETKIEGELYISLDRVRENALDLGVGEIEELNRVVIHGVLHLCGYEDKDETAQKEMQSAENKYISLIVSRET